jgi:hypothetical protein
MQKPATGDLLGTRLLTAVSASRVADHYWAAEDRGPVGAGFLNNVAIGRLTLSAAVRGKLRFYGVGSGRALYVDYLELDTYVANNLEKRSTLIRIQNLFCRCQRAARGVGWEVRWPVDLGEGFRRTEQFGVRCFARGQTDQGQPGRVDQHDH